MCPHPALPRHHAYRYHPYLSVRSSAIASPLIGGLFARFTGRALSYSVDRFGQVEEVAVAWLLHLSTKTHSGNVFLTLPSRKEYP